MTPDRIHWRRPEARDCNSGRKPPAPPANSDHIQTSLPERVADTRLFMLHLVGTGRPEVCSYARSEIRLDLGVGVRRESLVLALIVALELGQELTWAFLEEQVICPLLAQGAAGLKMPLGNRGLGLGWLRGSRADLLGLRQISSRTLQPAPAHFFLLMCES